MKSALSGTLATMCPALPYAVGAKFAHPDRPVIACVGDGAMQMLGINALVDIVLLDAALDRTSRRSCSCCTTTTSTRSRGSSA